MYSVGFIFEGSSIRSLLLHKVFRFNLRGIIVVRENLIQGEFLHNVSGVPIL